MDKVTAAFEKIKTEKNIDIKFNETMSKHCTYKIGGPADYFYSANSLDDLIEVLELAKSLEIPISIFGLGSNLLISDKGIRGLVIIFGKDFSKMGLLDELPSADLAGLNGIAEKLKSSLTEIKDPNSEVYVYSESGAALKDLSKFAAENSLSGLEFSCGIPGSVGGAVFMNAGAYGGMTENVCIQTYYLDEKLNLKVAKGAEQAFGYRQSIFQTEHGIILASIYKLRKDDQVRINADIADFTYRRSNSQPLELPSCGSVFKRPYGYYAGKLIMDSGLKGYRVGGAEVSTKHAGFIVNVDNATAQDVHSVIKHVQETVYNNYGVQLETEVRLVGEW